MSLQLKMRGSKRIISIVAMIQGYTVKVVTG
jgi:hypothetical protein